MLERLETECANWEIGPYHCALPGPMRLNLKIEGEIISKADFEVGFIHRGLEKMFEHQTWNSAIPYADRVDPEGAIFGELALCLAVEKKGEFEVPQRAQFIRILLCELVRISSHMKYLVEVAKSVGAETIVHYVLRDRERILDIFELLTGSRFSFNYLRYGGVLRDVSEGLLERVQDVVELIRFRMKEYNDLFSFNRSFLKRTCFTAPLSTKLIKRFGVTGPNARASGISFDVRTAYPYSGYDGFDFSSPVGTGEFGVKGDCHDRFLMRLREIAESLKIIKRISDEIPKGSYFEGDSDKKIPSGESFSRIETPRGMMICHIISDGSDYPARIQFRTPSLASLYCIPRLLNEARLGDIPILLASLDLSLAEIDK